MKKLYLSFLFVGFALFAVAQQNSGEIIYDVNVHMEFDLDNPDLPPEAVQFLEQMPKDIASARKLIFNDNSALFSSYDDPDAVRDPNENPMVMMMRRNMDNELAFMDLKDKMVTERKEFMGRVFLIKDSLETYNWKITGNQRQIAGFPCMEATTMKDSAEIKAWFTPSIATAAGPSGFSQLPGMILGMEMDASSMGGGPGGGRRGRMRGGNATISIQAREVDLRKVKKSEIEEPDKGKEVTREEFQEIVMEKIEEMRQQGGGPGFHMRGR